MILTELTYRTAVCKVSIFLWTMFWGLSRVGLLFPDVLWEFQKPERSQTKHNNNQSPDFSELKSENGWKRKEAQTWRGVFVLALFWWCWACSNDAKPGTFSRRSYYLCSVRRDHLSSRDICVFVLPIDHRDKDAYLVVSPQTCQSVRINHPEHQTVLILPSDVFLVAFITQQLIHIVPQQPALWQWIKHTILASNLILHIAGE